jgi:tetratricopeptide (TPR) repeat protein
MKLSDPGVIVAIITVVGALGVAVFNAPTVHHYFENEQPSVQAINPEKPSPIAAYSVIAWNAIASDREKDTIYYDFFLKGPSTGGKLKDMTGWTSSPNWTWETSDSDSGENTILVKANDLNHLNLNYSNQKDRIMIVNIEPYSGDKNRECKNLLDLGRYQSSINCYNSSIKLNPNNTDSWRNRGKALYNLGKVSEAIKSYDNASRLDPNLSGLWNDKGIALVATGNYAKAFECFQEQINKTPSNPMYWCNAGLALKDEGDVDHDIEDYNKAIRYYDEAIKLNPKLGKAYQFKANAFNASNRNTEAITALRQGEEAGI